MTDRLSLYFFPSPYGLDWASPLRLTLSTLANRISFLPSPKHPIGHVNIELTSESATPRRRFLTGMVAEDVRLQRLALLRDQVGLGVLFLSFPGHLESPEEIEFQFERRYRRGTISILTLQVNPRVRERLEQYHQEFREKRAFHSYGLPNRPRHLEGSGCSAFGASFLEVAGLDLAEFRQQWTRTLRVPEKYIGGPGTGRKVPLARLLADAPRRWAAPEEPHRAIFFWDPDLMHRWLRRTWQGLQSGSPLFLDRPFRLIQRHRALELEIDVTHIEPPSSPVWLSG